MKKFLIEVSHSPEHLACAKAIQVFLQSGSHYLTHAEWGCRDGVHCGWMMVEGADKEEVVQILPPAYRDEAKIVAVSHFSVEEIEEILRAHGGEAG